MKSARPTTGHGLALLLAATMLPAIAAAGPLRVAWGPHNAEPYAIVDGDRLVDGIIHDIGTLVAGRLAVPVEFVEVPRARNEEQLRSNRIDVVCITNREWMARPDDFLWSPRLFREAGAVIQRSGTAPWTQLADLEGKRIGTIIGYRYPNVEPLFAADRARRDDATDLASNMQRLAIGRLDAVIDSDIPARWWLTHNDRTGRHAVAKFVTSRHDVQCAISPQNAGRRIHQTFRQLLDNGALAGTLARYGITD
ncbi:MAG: substrate-binding periplasmic protein [Pseudomonadota bacterium]